MFTKVGFPLRPLSLLHRAGASLSPASVQRPRLHEAVLHVCDEVNDHVQLPLRAAAKGGSSKEASQEAAGGAQAREQVGIADRGEASFPSCTQTYPRGRKYAKHFLRIRRRLRCLRIMKNTV